MPCGGSLVNLIDDCRRVMGNLGWTSVVIHRRNFSLTFSVDVICKVNNNDNREVKHHVYVKRQTRICTTWPSFLFTCRLQFIISTHKLVVSRNFLSIRIVLSCFYLLIFYFEKFSTWIWSLPFGVYVMLKLSNNVDFLSGNNLANNA